ncbi:unnamed protein product [Trichogramma brassicae]|uniref:Ionotropic glutamate receptor C-terminal domain-containing protein n=1 Tax=Trichogramma brassicae TaxID=86971 RepID=A0A6H5I2R2_9HYME|nr:unnamed protein product [Trichogramma brassicae]
MRIINADYTSVSFLTAASSRDVDVILKRLSSTSINRKNFSALNWSNESTEKCSDRVAIVSNLSEAKYFLQSHGRKFNATDWNGGMIGQVYYREVDLAFGGIWISLDNNEFVALTEPWSQTRIHFLVPRPRSYSNVWALARPLSPAVWLLVGLALLLESAYLRGRALRDPRVPRRYRHLAVSLAESLGRLLGSATARVPPPLRLQFVLWQLVAVVLIACYNSSLSARLTNPDFERRYTCLFYSFT